ncbi:MAG TPA: hypothetical protein VKX17_20945 [Planctomycetota bacterium]|nr:hypothetical protein [Planctomycetota bacterium]
MIENRAEEALGEDVLDEHFIDGGLADVGIERGLAEREEGGEGFLEFAIRCVGVGDEVLKAAREFGDARAEIFDGVGELFDFGFGVAVEFVEQVGELLRVLQIDAQDFVFVLNQDGFAGVFEDDVVERVAARFFLGDFGVEGIGGIFGFPIAAGERVFVADDAVGADAGAAGDGGVLGDFGDESPAAGVGGVGEELLEGGADGHFVIDALGGDGFEALVLVLDGAVGGFDGVGHIQDSRFKVQGLVSVF